MVTRASTVTHAAQLSSDFGLEWATKAFGADVIEQLEKFQSGPRKGKVKGWFVWINVESGGWDRRYGVMKPGKFSRAWLAATEFGEPLEGIWMGRPQQLAGPRTSLFDEGRARHAREQALIAAQYAAEKAEIEAERLSHLT